MKTVFLQVVIFSTLIIGLATSAFCATVDFSWKPNKEPNLAGYIIYYGFASRDYQYSLDIENPPLVDGRVSGSVTGLESNTLYYFTVTAYDVEGNESDDAHELAYYVPLGSNFQFSVWTGYLNDDQIQDHLFLGDDGTYAIYGSATQIAPPVRIASFVLDLLDPQEIGVGDVDDDDIRDVVICSYSGLGVVYGGIGDENFEESMFLPTDELFVKGVNGCLEKAREELFEGDSNRNDLSGVDDFML